jgi:hypothetical protein
MKRWTLIFAFIFGFAAHSADVTKGNFGAAKEEQSNPKNERKSEAKPRAATYPFYGTLDSVDSKQKTITLRGKKKNRVIIVTEDTRVQKSGAAATIQDGTPGERVSGSVRKNAAGQEEAVTVRFGPKE